jgi:hypothetical protein
MNVAECVANLQAYICTTGCIKHATTNNLSLT